MERQKVYILVLLFTLTLLFSGGCSHTAEPKPFAGETGGSGLALAALC